MTFESFLLAVDEGEEKTVLSEMSMQPQYCDRRDPSGIRALMRAKYNGHSALASAIAEASKPLDLFEASAIGDLKQVSEILEIEKTAINTTSPDGFTPLSLAAFMGNEDIVRLLLAEGADPNQDATNPSVVRPIHSAVANRDNTTALSITDILLKAGADPNLAQRGGYRPLHSAAAHGREELVELLLTYHADVSATSDDMATAASMARDEGYLALADALENR